MIDELAKIPLGSTVEDVMKLAEKIGFKFDSKEFAVPAVVEMTDEDVPRSRDSLPLEVNKDTDLSKFKNGTLKFGLSLFLFERKGCEIAFKDGMVKNVRTWWLD